MSVESVAIDRFPMPGEPSSAYRGWTLARPEFDSSKSGLERIRNNQAGALKELRKLTLNDIGKDVEPAYPVGKSYHQVKLDYHHFN
ncbi:MAG: hypothetical protein G01um10147_194 [Microgenomates group bacterium Gr01-1014_7]|nr:MAG: hypothetical protein G01um10147_194 [Microgenomates group bacterium Gr01-1014_7]